MTSARWYLSAALLIMACLQADAEQMRRLGSWDVHYALVPTTFLKPEVAARYQITRGRDRAMINISVLDGDGSPVRVRISGTMINLLGQREPLEFREVLEGPAVYYLVEIKHTDREVLRFEVDITPPDGKAQQLTFQQEMYWEGR